MSLSHEAQNFKLGLYEHFKGNRYQAVGLARHSETLEEYVVYKALYGKEELWIRPLAMFCEMVEVEGVIQPRFRLIESV